MTAQLPGSFTAKMKQLLGPEYQAFAATYNEAPYGGIRVNTLKIPVDRLLALSPFGLEPIPWCPAGFYTEAGARPGKHPYYHAGLYYIQEPSAMAPAELLGVTPGDRVLDLCAAPGGKSTQIAAKLGGEGLLVSNDLHPDRTKALAKNLELYGVRNAVVLNESPERIAAAFPQFFDKILIDAPCSGEGMFRKDEDMVRQWDDSTPAKYAAMQDAILDSAAAALAPGGTLVYSTCTFSPEENEGSIARFLERHPSFEPVPVGGSGPFSAGLNGLPETARLWPHKIKGEGHFIAVLRHNGAAGGDEPLTMSVPPAPPRREGGGREGREPASSVKLRRGGGRGAGQGGCADRSGRGAPSGLEPLEVFAGFAEETLGWVPQGNPIVFGEHLYLSPLPQERLNGLKAVRPGWYMGQLKSGRFIPGHPLATALKPEECRRTLSLPSGNREAVSYLKGETLSVPAEALSVPAGMSPKGYVLVCIDGYSAGWGKWQDGMLKNEYPAGWRWT